MEAASRLPLTERCLHYEELHEVPFDLQKYWQQRYSIFQLYDNGIQMTDDAWFGVTPELVAIKIAEDLSFISTPEKTTIVDLFAGAGGNAIAFALSAAPNKRWDRVIAIEKDADTLACAQHNAEVYGVSDRITWVQGDCFEFLRLAAATSSSPLSSALQISPATTVLFGSPPWGGVAYRDQDVFDLSTMEPYNLAALNRACRRYDHLLYLPRTSDLRQIAALVPPDEKVEVVQYCMVGAAKAMVAYVPALKQSPEAGPGDPGRRPHMPEGDPGGRLVGDSKQGKDSSGGGGGVGGPKRKGRMASPRVPRSTSSDGRPVHNLEVLSGASAHGKRRAKGDNVSSRANRRRLLKSPGTHDPSVILPASNDSSGKHVH